MTKKTTVSKNPPIHSSTKEKEEKLARMTFEAPASLRKAFKLKAAEEEKSIKDILCELMESYVKNRN